MVFCEKITDIKIEWMFQVVDFFGSLIFLLSKKLTQHPRLPYPNYLKVPIIEPLYFLPETISS